MKMVLKKDDARRRRNDLILHMQMVVAKKMAGLPEWHELSDRRFYVWRNHKDRDRLEWRLTIEMQLGQLQKRAKGHMFMVEFTFRASCRQTGEEFELRRKLRNPDVSSLRGAMVYAEDAADTAGFFQFEIMNTV